MLGIGDKAKSISEIVNFRNSLKVLKLYCLLLGLSLLFVVTVFNIDC